MRVSSAVDGLHVVENSFEGVHLPLEMALGEGENPVWISGNLIQGAQTAVKSNGHWTGWFLDNVVVDSEKVLEVERAQDLSIKGNWVRFEEQAIRIDDGSAVLENNIVDGAGGSGVAGILGSEGQGDVFELYGNDFITSGDVLFSWPNDATVAVWAANRTLYRFRSVMESKRPIVCAPLSRNAGATRLGVPIIRPLIRSFALRCSWEVFERRLLWTQSSGPIDHRFFGARLRGRPETLRGGL